MTPARVIAGIDVGNATTEVVLAAVGPTGEVDVVAHGRVTTRRAKGSPESLHAAAALVARLGRSAGPVTEAVVAPLRPVDTHTVTVPGPRPDTGRLTVVSSGAGTTGGHGVGAGPPYVLRADDAGPPGRAEPAVVLVPAGTGFRTAVRLLAPLVAAGHVAAVCLADDEGVLVANRLPRAVPVVDEVDVDRAAGAERLLVEVAEHGRPLRSLTDPLLVTSSLRLPAGEAVHAARIAPLLSGVPNAVLALGAQRVPDTDEDPRGWARLRKGDMLDLAGAVTDLPGHPVGWVRAVATPPDMQVLEVDDLWGVDLAAVVDAVHGRRAALGPRPVGLAALRAEQPRDPAGDLVQLLGVPVSTAGSEGSAARAGALTTPGATDAAQVVDLGAGTVDVVTPAAEVVAAGGGALLTAAVAAVTGATLAAAEQVKRAASFRVEAPQLLLAEDTTRTFLDHPVDRDAVGALVVPGPAGLLPFHRSLAPAEWRGLRLRLKTDVLGRNVARAIRAAGDPTRPVVLVGGPAHDDEVLTAVTSALPPDVVVGRGNVAGRLGPRYAVALGLVRLAAARRTGGC